MYNTISEDTQMLSNSKRKLFPGNGHHGLAVALLFLLAAGFTAVANAGTRAVEGLEFDRVVLWGNGELEISQADVNHLRVKGKDKDLDREPFYVKGDTLYLGRIDGGLQLGNLQFKLSAKKLRGLTLKGSGEIFVKPLTVENLSVELEGSGDINLFAVSGDELSLEMAGSGGIRLAKATVKELEVVVAGSGSVEIGAVQADSVTASVNGSGDIVAAEEGAALEVTINVVGSGEVELEQIRAPIVEVNIMGSGDTAVWAEKELNVSIMGSGDVAYHGDPKVSSNMLGSGDVEKLDD
jgi:hypothetical protein